LIFLQQVINGVSQGSIYALIALGYTMVYGIIKLINFAHGDIYMVGAFVGYWLATRAGMASAPGAVAPLLFLGTLAAAMALCAALGAVVERVAYKPLRNSSRIAVLITAIGMSLLLEYGMMYFVGPQVRSYPKILPSRSFQVGGAGAGAGGGATVNSQQIVIVAVTVALMAVLQFIVMRTRRGKAMRAVSQDRDAALLMGIDVDQTISFTFMLGSALAGAAGVLVGMYYNSINPLMGVTIGLKAFIAAVFGGIGSIPGAMVGGVGIGVIETLVMGYSNSMYRDAAVFAILIAILILRPSGLFGKDAREKV
jgi:branched-chain amino acid transport system permease protein